MIPALTAALHVELRKLAASRVIRATTVLVVVGIAALTAALTSAARSGNEQVAAQLGAFADAHGWELLTGVAAQITAAGGLLAFGVALSWIVGREFGDGTINSLYALPVSRRAIVSAKLLSHLLWTVLVVSYSGQLAGIGWRFAYRRSVHDRRRTVIVA